MTTTVLMTLWNPTAAGAPVMAAEFAERLFREGTRVVLAHGPAPAGAHTVLPRFEAIDATIVRLPALRGRGWLRGLWALRRAIADHEVDIVIGFQQRDRPLALLAARLHRLPSVIHCGAPVHLTGSAFARRAKALTHQTTTGRWANLVVCPSPAVRTSVIDMLGVPADRTRTIYNGVDTGAVRRAAQEGQLTDDRVGPLRLLCVGRFERQKGQDILLDALAEIPGAGERWLLELVGDRTAARDPDDFAATLDATLGRPDTARGVLRLGWRTDVWRLLGTCDLYVQPSRWEGWSLALSEAMAAGCAVVFTDCSGPPPGFVDGQHGWMVPTDDPVALRHAIERALALTPEQRRTIGDAAADLAATTLDIERCTTEFTAAVRNLAES